MLHIIFCKMYCKSCDHPTAVPEPFCDDINLGPTSRHCVTFQGRYNHFLVSTAPGPDDPSRQTIYFMQGGVQTLNHHPILDPPAPSVWSTSCLMSIPCPIDPATNYFYS